MKAIIVIITVLIGGLFPATPHGNNFNGNTQEIKEGNIEVYYFHYSRRCATCQAVEDESLKALEELFPEKMKNGSIVFLALNIEEDKNQAIADNLGVNGQTLLIVKGGNKKNLTNTAFMHARSNPDKLKKAIEDAIASL